MFAYLTGNIFVSILITILVCCLFIFLISLLTEKTKANPFLIGLSIIFTMLTYFIWKKSGQDKQVIETIEFYAPKGLNSLEVGFLYKGKIDVLHSS